MPFLAKGERFFLHLREVSRVRSKGLLQRSVLRMSGGEEREEELVSTFRITIREPPNLPVKIVMVKILVLKLVSLWWY
jgi:hypothetical protein